MLDESIQIFPCDCKGEGVVVQVEYEDVNGDFVSVSRDEEMEDEYDSFCINLSFWGLDPNRDGRLTRWGRIKAAWRVLRHGNPWLDMVMLPSAVARKFANHILYLSDEIEFKQRKKLKQDTKKSDLAVPTASLTPLKPTYSESHSQKQLLRIKGRFQHVLARNFGAKPPGNLG